ncbi:MAG: dTMP kinase [Mycobacterium leprae]
MGLFISVEGVDGSGKSTQLSLLLAYLDQKGVPYVFTREPGGTPLAEEIRRVLLDPVHAGMPVLTEAFLFAAGRADHVERVIRPALATGKLVISDRFVDASLVFQSFAGGLPLEFVQAINREATGGLAPDRTIVLDLPPDVARQRRSGRSDDRIEQKEEAYHHRVREGYLLLARKEPDRVKLVDASGNIEAVQAKIRALVDEIL